MPSANSILGWLFYVGLTVLGWRQDKRARFFVIYVILCVSLILDVIGCHQTIRTVRT